MFRKKIHFVQCEQKIEKRKANFIKTKNHSWFLTFKMKKTNYYWNVILKTV